MLPRFSFRRPTNLRSALETLHTHPARIHAGGTDLLGCLRDRVFDADAVVSLGAIDELKGIRKGLGGDMVIGAMTTIDAIARDPDVITRFAALAQAATAVASPQLRAQGTLGGNLCQKTRCWYYRGQFPCLRKGGDHCFAYEGRNEHHCIFGGEGCYMVHPSDTAPALAALGAICRISGPTTSRSVPVEQFHIAGGLVGSQHREVAPPLGPTQPQDGVAGGDVAGVDVSAVVGVPVGFPHPDLGVAIPAGTEEGPFAQPIDIDIDAHLCRLLAGVLRVFCGGRSPSPPFPLPRGGRAGR